MECRDYTCPRGLGSPEGIKDGLLHNSLSLSAGSRFTIVVSFLMPHNTNLPVLSMHLHTADMTDLLLTYTPHYFITLLGIL